MVRYKVNSELIQQIKELAVFDDQTSGTGSPLLIFMLADAIVNDKQAGIRGLQPAKA